MTKCLVHDHVQVDLAVGSDWACYNGDMGSESTKFYGRGLRVWPLLVTILKVSYLDRDLRHLIIVPPLA